MADSAPQTARARARAELTHEITETAKRHLAEKGPGELSLRAVARELGMVSSALYRYFPSRDALLTQLIIDAYNSLGPACEDAHAQVDPSDYPGRWRAICHAARDWAVANPHEYALIYGSPVPGYAAPQDTVDPASRILVLLVGLLIDADAAGKANPPHVPMSRPFGASLTQWRKSVDVPINNQQLMAGITAWTLLFGLISFEVFGRFTGMVEPVEDVFDHQITRAAAIAGLT